MVSPDVLYVMKNLGLSEEEAVSRLARADLATIVGAAAQRKLQERFAGVWCDLGADLIMVGAVGPHADLSALERDTRLTGHVCQVSMEYSEVELLSVASELTKLTRDSSTYSLVGVELPINRVVVYRTGASDPSDSSVPLLEKYLREHRAVVEVRDMAQRRAIGKLPSGRGLI
jgi:hypothetical protein